MNSALEIRFEAGDRLMGLHLARPKANLIDAEMIAALEAALAQPPPPALSAIVIDAEGPNFSFGASVAEHLPDQCRAMLAALHRLIGRIVASEVPVLVAAHGRCLGAGLELALCGHLLFVAPDAELGQPEIRLGVFAPAASCLLPELIGPSRALDLLLSGRSVSGTQAVSMGLACQAHTNPAQAARAYAAEYLLRNSASSMRYAVRAARLEFAARIKQRLAQVERLYLEELMSSRDAIEGLEAFLAKRPPQWEHR